MGNALWKANRAIAADRDEEEMIRPPTEIRSAKSDEVPHAVAAIVAAFLTDPPARFAWPSPHHYLPAMSLAVREFAGSSFKHGTAYVSADFCGAALWLPPGVEPNGEALEKVFRDTATGEHLDDLLATFEKMGQSHPKEAHWYLPLIGVEPNAQGKGLGAALMHHALARCDQERALAYLEASKPENVPFYMRHGFEVTGEIQIGAAPLVTPMFRRPRPWSERQEMFCARVLV
jgi:GNAT superfamily N-acetyltransferase